MHGVALGVSGGIVGDRVSASARAALLAHLFHLPDWRGMGHRLGVNSIEGADMAAIGKLAPCLDPSFVTVGLVANMVILYYICSDSSVILLSLCSSSPLAYSLKKIL